MLRKKFRIIQFWLQDHAWFQNYSEAAFEKKRIRRATSTGTKEGRHRRETSSGTQPEAGGTSKSMKEENPCPGKKEKGDKHRNPIRDRNPSQNQEQPANHDEKEPSSEKRKKEREKKRKAPNPQMQPAEVNKA